MSDNSGGGGSWGPEEKQAKDKYAQIRDVLSKYGFNPNDAFKPSTAGTGTVGAVYNPNTGGAIGTSGSLPGQFNQNANIRLGDYSQDAQGNWKVVTNSPTDLANKFVTSNAASLQGLSFEDYAKAAGRAVTSSFGVPSGDNVAEMAGTGIAGGLLGNAATPGPLKAIWAIGNFADSLIDAQDAKTDAYLNQDFDYDLALDFYKDDKGDIRFKPNYKKMAEGGSESGKAVLAAQNINMTDVSMSDDNKMNINVSPVFAASDRYKEALKFIKNTYGTLTKEQADEVVDKDTGKTRLQTIEDYLKSEQSNYLYNAQTIKDIKEKAPNASEKSLNIAADTSKIGYLNEDQLSKVKVSVYNKNNQLEEVNAKVYLDSIKNMSKVERNDYMLSLGNRMNDPSISDDEKAVLYAQSRALYAASDLDGGYKGMYQRDFLDEIGSMPEAFTGMTWNTIFDGTDLETFRQDEFSSGLYSLASTGASIVTLSKATNLIEKGIRKVPGLSKLSKAVGDTSRQAVASTLSAAEKTGESAALTLAKIAGKTAGQLGFQVAADALYDAAKIIPYALKDNMDEYDFLKELGNDFVMDMLITYGPRSFAGSMNANATKTEYRVAYENTKTGDVQYFRPKDVKPDSNYKMLEGPDGTRDSKLVDITSEELATRHAKAIDSLTDSNAALKVQELIFDKNAAMSKLAVQVRSVSDRYHYHKMLRYAADARQITEDTLATFLGKNNVSQHWETMRNTFKEVAPKVKDLSKADQNYIKAVVNEARFLGKNAGDKKAETVIKNFYKNAKSGVDVSRAEELNTLIKAMQDVAADVLDFYVEKGLMKAKDVKELRSQPGYEDGYLPMYMSTDVKSSTGGDVGQDRALYKKVKDAKALIAIDDLDNPLNSLARYINNAMRAVAMNDRALAIREAASMAGVGIHLVEDSGGAMKDIVNLKEFDAGFKKIYKDIAIKTKKSLPSQKEWQETNDKMVLRSNALKAAQKVQELQDESKQLHNENRRLRRQIKKLGTSAVKQGDGSEQAGLKKYTPMYRGQGTGVDDFYVNDPKQKTASIGDGYFLARDKGVSSAFEEDGGGIISPLIDNSKIASADEVLDVFKKAEDIVSKKSAGKNVDVTDDMIDLYEKAASGQYEAVAKLLDKPVVEFTDRAGGDEFVYYKGIDNDFDADLKNQLKLLSDPENKKLIETYKESPVANSYTLEDILYGNNDWESLSLKDRLEVMDEVNSKKIKDSAVIEEIVRAKANPEAVSQATSSTAKVETPEVESEQVKNWKEQIADAEDRLREVTPQKSASDVAKMSYERRKALAQAVAYKSNGDYVVLYRVQKGTPDDFRPNDTSVAGKFEATGMPYLNGAVWLTSNPDWAEGSGRATAGIKEGTPESDISIVAIPVKKSLIENVIYDGGDTTGKGYREKLKEHGKKIVQTRGYEIDDVDGAAFKDRLRYQDRNPDDAWVKHGLDSTDPVKWGNTEFILWKQDAQDVFDDGMELMLKEHNEQAGQTANKRQARRIEGELDEANNALKAQLDEEATAKASEPEAANVENQIEELFGKINTNRTLIADNKQQQLMYLDDMKRYTGNLMERAQKAHKGSDAKLDIKLYLDVQVTNSLKQSLKSDNMVGQVQGVLNRAVQAANPWVDPQVVIERRAHAAAIRYRNKIANDLKEETKKNKKEGINSDRINAAVDRAMDKVLEKITGERKAEVTFIDDEGNATTKMLDNYEDSHTIRYMLNGKEQRMVLDGQGSEELVAEFYAPEFTTPKTALGKVMNKITRKGNEVAQIKRYLTTSADISRVIPNIMRDWSRGIVSTGGQIVLSPEKYFAELSEQYGYTPEQVKIINNGLMLAREAIDKSTLTSSLQMPNKNRDKSMVRAMTAPDGNGFVRYMYDLKTGGAGKVFSALQDLGETFTRKRAMDIAYYQELARAQGEGRDLDVAIKRAVEAAYFSGRESTVNFRRRGVLIGKIAQSVPYLTQRFATLQSFTYSYLNDPVGVANALKTTVSAYTALVAIALSNEESRKKYFMLNEYDRANNIIIPIDNGLIITLPLDDTIAAFLTPYRRMVESMNGLDPQAFYLCFAEGLAALSPADLSGFSEGDGFNVARGFEKLGAEFIPTWAQPFVEAYIGKDLYYGSALSVNNDYTGSVYGTWNPTPGQMTTQSRNSKTLATISDNTGIPQWILQNFLSEYGGNIGQYVLNTVDKIGGATEAQQGGKEWMDSVFKPFTGLDSDSASNAFYDLVNGLKEEKTKVQNEIKTLTQRANNAGGEEKAELLNQRQKKIEQYGLHVTDAIENYLSAFEITGGLSKKQANQVWYLYKLYDEDSNDKLYLDNTTGDYYTDKARAWNNKQATSLAAGSGIDSVVRQPVSDYYDSYAEQAFKQTSYGDTYHYIAEIEDIMNDNKINRSEMFKNYDKMTSAQKKQWKAAWNTKVVKALAPYIQKTGIDNVLDQRKIVDYLDEVIFVSNPWNTKQYLKKIFGGK